MPYVRVGVHLVWSTKRREKLINPDLRIELLEHIKENAMKKEIAINAVNAVADHIHLLVFLRADQSLAKVVQLIKGESSKWVNDQKILTTKFAWQNGYYAVAVDRSAEDGVRRYIDNQEEHHRVKSFAEEWEAELQKAGFEIKGLKPLED